MKHRNLVPSLLGVHKFRQYIINKTEVIIFVLKYSVSVRGSKVGLVSKEVCVKQRNGSSLGAASARNCCASYSCKCNTKHYIGDRNFVKIICSPKNSSVKLINSVLSQHKNVNIHTNPNGSTYVNIDMISFKGL